MQEVHREAEELARYYGELTRRLEQTGVRGVPELLALHERVERAVAAVSRQEIEWAQEHTRRLIDELVRLDAALQSLRTLKAVVGASPDRRDGRA